MHHPTRSRSKLSAAVTATAAFLALAGGSPAQAADIDLGTAAPFVVLGGSTVTNTGTSVLDGDLGVSPGTALVGFGSPTVVNGATHAADGVAANAQADLTTAYNVAAGQPVQPANELTGQDLGGLSLTPGAYRFTSSAQLTGQLTLDAQGDPAAQFVFEIGSTLTTASASSVLLTNGASPCNVFWQVGSSATLGTTTSFQGNLMAYEDISLDSGATVVGRLLAARQITLISNVLDNSGCRTATVVPATTPTAGSTAAGTTPAGVLAGAGPANGPAAGAPMPLAGSLPARRGGTATLRRTPRQRCTEGFRATFRGQGVARVVFTLDGRRIPSLRGRPFQVFVRAAPGSHSVRAHVTFRDGSAPRTFRLGYRACGARLQRPRPGPSRFTG